MDSETWYNTDKGASFCHVSKINRCYWDTVNSGTVKSNGDHPSLMVRANVITIGTVRVNISVIVL